MSATTDVHVLPLEDLRLHDERRQCWCRPRVDVIGIGGAVVVHHALDGREYFEPGGPGVQEVAH